MVELIDRGVDGFVMATTRLSTAAQWGEDVGRPIVLLDCADPVPGSPPSDRIPAMVPDGLSRTCWATVIASSPWLTGVGRMLPRSIDAGAGRTPSRPVDWRTGRWSTARTPVSAVTRWVGDSCSRRPVPRQCSRVAICRRSACSAPSAKPARVSLSEHQEEDDVGAAADQHPGRRGRAVAELGDRGQHPLSGGFGDDLVGGVVQHVADGCLGHPGAPRHLGGGGPPDPAADLRRCCHGADYDLQSLMRTTDTHQ